MQLNLLQFKLNWHYYFIGVLLTGRAIDFIRLPMPIFYGAIIFLLVLHFPQPKNLKIQNKSVVVFILAVFLTILFNEIDHFFKPYERYFSFLLNLLVFGPILISRSFIRFRLLMLETFCQIFTFITIASFFFLLIGIVPLDGFGGFQGLTVHAMTLSSIAGISFIYLIKINYVYRSKGRFFRFVFFLAIAICFFVVILSASRAALAGAVVAGLLFMYKISKGNFIKILKVGTISFFLLIISFPLWSNYSGRIMHKFETSDQKNNMFASREELWQARFNEFYTSPIIGIGFGNLLKEYNDYGINEDTGGIETGSSWGMVLSMTGLVGFLLYAYINFSRLLILFRSSHNIIFTSFVLSLLFFFIIHMAFEGYVFASGNILMIFFWLLISVSDYSLMKLKEV